VNKKKKKKYGVAYERKYFHNAISLNRDMNSECGY
jgi:hypothetical protein